MSKTAIVTIVGAAIAAGIAAAIPLFPDIKEILVAVAGLVGAILTLIGAKKLS